MMNVTGINGITYSSDARDDCAKFFADWGLQRKIEKNASNVPSAQIWETLNASTISVLSPADAAHLPPAMEPGATLRAVDWAVASADALARIATALEGAAGFQRNADGSVHADDPHGVRVTFSLDRRASIAMKGAPSNPFGAEQRIDAPSPIYDRATPIEIGHVVLFTENLNEAETFYARLGFVVTDRYPGRGVFMRGSVRGGHHDLFMLQIPNKAKGLNHIAFTVRDIHEVFGGGLHMSRCGWKTQLGPGRHPISSAYFWYFECPAGGLIEYNADEDQLTENWTPREFQPGPTMFAEWAIDGGIDGHTRRQPNVEAGGKFLTEKR